MKYRNMDREEYALHIERAYKEVFSTESGKMVLYDLANRANFVRNSHVENDAMTTAHNEGRRALFLHIVKNLELDILGIGQFSIKGETK